MFILSKNPFVYIKLMSKYSTFTAFKIFFKMLLDPIAPWIQILRLEMDGWTPIGRNQGCLQQGGGGGEGGN